MKVALLAATLLICQAWLAAAQPANGTVQLMEVTGTGATAKLSWKVPNAMAGMGTVQATIVPQAEADAVFSTAPSIPCKFGSGVVAMAATGSYIPNPDRKNSTLVRYSNLKELADVFISIGMGSTVGDTLKFGRGGIGFPAITSYNCNDDRTSSWLMCNTAYKARLSIVHQNGRELATGQITFTTADCPRTTDVGQTTPSPTPVFQT